MGLMLMCWAVLACWSQLSWAAALKPGDVAPDFSTEAALGGKTFRFSLADALKKGPVVVYFYPKAFTTGCTIEAHNFAEAIDRYAALGASVVGVSHDSIETLKKFSVEECRNKFAVAADLDSKIMKAYGAALWINPNMADRISYVLGPDAKVIYVYSSLSPDQHVEKTLKALSDWKAARRP
jgi:peroxiredoxin (alkyl hydroperoxide reductase subunit C)